MGRLFLVELVGKSFRCRLCGNSMALVDDVFSRIRNPLSIGCHMRYYACVGSITIPYHLDTFNCSLNPAYLFRKVVNITAGPQEVRKMLSGTHMVEDIFCCCCEQYLGWKYVKVQNEDHSYKEGKFVLERRRIIEDGADKSNMETM